jgi:hypothetical protein
MEAVLNLDLRPFYPRMKVHVLMKTKFPKITIFSNVTSCDVVKSASWIFWVVASFTLKKKVVGLPETLIIVYQVTRRHSQEGENLWIYRHKNLKCHTNVSTPARNRIPGLRPSILNTSMYIDSEAGILKLKFHFNVQLIPLPVRHLIVKCRCMRNVNRDMIIGIIVKVTTIEDLPRGRKASRESGSSVGLYHCNTHTHTHTDTPWHGSQHASYVTVFQVPTAHWPVHQSPITTDVT